MDRDRATIEHDAPYVNVLVEPTDGIITIRWKNYAPSGFLFIVNKYFYIAFKNPVFCLDGHG